MDYKRFLKLPYAVAARGLENQDSRTEQARAEFNKSQT